MLRRGSSCRQLATVTPKNLPSKGWGFVCMTKPAVGVAAQHNRFTRPHDSNHRARSWTQRSAYRCQPCLLPARQPRLLLLDGSLPLRGPILLPAQQLVKINPQAVPVCLQLFPLHIAVGTGMNNLSAAGLAVNRGW